jgi:predicted small lipoprotein YifL
MRATRIMFLIVLLVQGCGHKGPLLMPQTPANTKPSNQGQ